jgi:hypothetical protein
MHTCNISRRCCESVHIAQPLLLGAPARIALITHRRAVGVGGPRAALAAIADLVVVVAASVLPVNFLAHDCGL